MAAGKVNVKFVAGLIAVLVALVGGGGMAAYLMLFQNGTRLAAQGDAAADQGDWVKAEKLYSKAVNKEQTNAAYISKWIAAMEKLTPETQNGYASKYQSEYLSALRALARAKKTDVEAHVNAIKPYHDSMRYTLGASGMTDIAEATASALEYFSGAADKKHEVLRRFRGMAYVRGWVGAANLKEQEIALAKQDLEAALAVDPSDGESATALSKWYKRRSDLLGSQEAEASREANEAGRKLLAEFQQRNPGNAEVALRVVEIALDDLQEGVNEAGSAEERRRVADRLSPVMKDAIEHFAGVLEKSEASKMLPELTLSLMRMEGFQGIGEGKAERPERLARRVCEAQPGNPAAFLVLAQILATAGKPVDALAELQRAVDIKQAPISHAGQRQFGERAVSRSFQAQYAIQAWGVETDAAKKKEWLDRAGEYRAKYAEVVGPTDTELLLLDAQIDYAKEDFGAAQKKLLDYNTKVNGSNAQAVRMLAECSYRMMQFTRAEEFYKQVVSREPGNLLAVMRLAGMCQAQGRNDESIQMYQYALQIDPKNELAKAQLDLLTARKNSGVADASDPVIKGLLEADRLEQEGKADEALAKLREMYKKAPDSRVAIPLAARIARRGDKAEAMRIVDERLAVDKDNRQLSNLKIALTYDDPCKQREMAITESPTLTELQKALALWSVYRDCGRKAEATAMLAKAKSIDPQNIAVIEFEFIEALDRKDFDSADKLAEESRKRDSDLVDGATFRARILDAQGKLNDAVRVLEDATKKPSFGVEPARLLAALYTQQRRLPEAVAVLRTGLAKNNTHRESLLALGSLLVQMGRDREALEEVRARQQIHTGDPQVTNMWLELEATVGNREVAVERRKRQLEVSPNDREAQISLARLYVQNKDWKLARELLDRVRAGGLDLRTVEIDAQWYADQANMAGARKVFDDYIAGIPKDKLTSETLLAKGNFLERLQQSDAAAEAYAEATNLQDPKTRQADKAMADLLLRRGKLPEAAAAFGEIVKAGADTAERTYAKRQIDALLQMRKGPEALAALEAMGPSAKEDAQLLGQLAEASRLSGDKKKSAEALDLAVSKFPGDAVVYHRRALANQEFEELRVEVLRDLDRAIQLRPDYWQARRDKARFLVRGKNPDMDGAIKEMREAVKYNPQIDELRITLMRELFTVGRDSDALEVAEEVASKRTNDVQLLVNLGALFREAGKDDRAADYYRRAYELSAQPFVVIAYIDLLHSMQPRNLEQVDRVLLKVGSAVIESEPALMMARAKQLLFRGKQDDGLRDVMNALRLIKPNQQDLVMAWFGDVKRNAPTQVDRVLDLAERDKLIPGWPKFFRAGTLLEKPEGEKRAMAMLEEVVSQEKDDTLVRQAYLILQAKYYQANDCSNGLRVMREAAVRYPEDSFLLNNLAFFMVKCGEDAKLAVPVAEKALQKATENGRDLTDVLDTLGWIYMKAGRLDDAQRPILQALSLAGGQPVRATIMLHLTELLVLQGKPQDAQAVLNDAIKVFSEQKQKGVGQEEQLADVKKKVEEALKAAK